MSLQTNNGAPYRPTAAFVGASWVALLIGLGTYFIGLFNAEMALNEKGYYFVTLMFGLFAVISLQKSVRDRSEGIPVTAIYYGLAWFCTVLAVALVVIGLWNADLLLSEKGFFGLGFILSLFAVVAVQKNVRDAAGANSSQPIEEPQSGRSYPSNSVDE